jgi:cellulose synthase/poly-beta-1,6-N-acetylglucosamine synthase-like glycosyltransferase
MWLYSFLFLILLLFILYAIIILLYRKWFLQLQPFAIPANNLPVIRFSVIIPARNEENNIGSCLQALIKQQYPYQLFEVIIIDDFSEDKTVEIIEVFQHQYPNIRLLKMADILNNHPVNAYKKKAIELAVHQAKGNWILTSDADCLFGQHWLAAFDAYIQKEKPVFVAAPVVFSYTHTILSIFQYLDFLSLQGITAAAVSAGFHSMCNGANLAYKKEVFIEVGGFSGIDHIASGDDMLLMNKIKKQYPENVGFLFTKAAIVTTAPMPDWKSFFNQRIRWASKADQYQDKSIFAVLLLVYLFNFSLAVLPIMACFKPLLWLYWLGFILLKTIVELSFTIPVGKFFGKPFIGLFLLFQPLHIIYTVIAGWLGKFGTYQWKGRKVQ